MLWTKRDGKRGGEHFPIPTEGEIEGKLIVLESIAIACIEGCISHCDAAAVAKLRENVVCLVHERCEPLKLTSDDELAAQEYAVEFFNAAVEEALERAGTR